MEGINHTVLQQSVIKTLLYYDVFNYPLKSEEVYHFLGTNSVTQADVHQALEVLVSREQAFRFGDLFSVHNDLNNAVRRLNGNREAARHMTLALQRARLLAKFPFVQAVMASGSFSKGYMDEKSDLDFFIVTSPGRLWIARTLIVMFKRLFFFNSHRYFCCNYFVDTEHLEIEDKNLFTATELATLLPLYNAGLYRRLIEKNRWLLNFFPNYKMRSQEHVAEDKQGAVRRILESLMSRKFWNKVESFFMNTTLRRWKRIYEKQYAATDFNLMFRTREYVSKNHPNHFQRKVLKRYEDKLNWFNDRYNVPFEKAV